VSSTLPPASLLFTPSTMQAANTGVVGLETWLIEVE
jgi:hypothetical protein